MHRWIDHTSELELQLRASSAEQIFTQATVAVGEVLGDPTGERSTRSLSVEARDRAGLLAAWLEELVFLSEQEGLIPVDASVTLGDGQAAGEVEFRDGRASYLVKAVTYHRLSLEHVDDGWTATAVLDI